jgi:drug/metabolite transporter (DMT)-like permease
MASLFLMLSVVFSTLINLIFRWFKQYEVNKFQAIVVNYLICFGLGYSLSDHRDILENINASWFPFCILLGFIFVGIFFSMALTTEKLGISVTAVSGKMSVVIPILFAYFVYDEFLSILFWLGLLLSLLSIYFVSIKKNSHIEKNQIILPLIVFFGSGIIDSSLKMLQASYNDVSMDTISYSIFMGAFIAGLSIYLIRNKGSLRNFELKSLKAGVLLGIPNYFSIFFLLSAISGFSDSSALVFGLNNVGIVLLSTVLSVIIFEETLSGGNRLGLVLALVSILLITYAV